MDESTHIGLDVHKETIAVAVLRPGATDCDERVIPWGANTRSCRALVLVDQSAEKISPLDVRNAVDLFDRRGTLRSQELKASMRSLLVVVLRVGPQNPVQVPGTKDQQPVQHLTGPRSSVHLLC